MSVVNLMRAGRGSQTGNRELSLALQERRVSRDELLRLYPETVSICPWNSCVGHPNANRPSIIHLFQYVEFKSVLIECANPIVQP